MVEATSTAGIPGPPPSEGGGALLAMDLSQQEEEQGLREALHERRSVRICCDDTPHGKAIGSCLILFQTVSIGSS
jgi:hypothetical protein